MIILAWKSCIAAHVSLIVSQIWHWIWISRARKLFNINFQVFSWDFRNLGQKIWFLTIFGLKTLHCKSRQVGKTKKTDTGIGFLWSKTGGINIGRVYRRMEENVYFYFLGGRYVINETQARTIDFKKGANNNFRKNRGEEIYLRKKGAKTFFRKIIGGENYYNILKIKISFFKITRLLCGLCKLWVKWPGCVHWSIRYIR